MEGARRRAQEERGVQRIRVKRGRDERRGRSEMAGEKGGVIEGRGARRHSTVFRHNWPSTTVT